jgi:mannose-6-phosphate isomerase-like protein (cupin superfamily)
VADIVDIPSKATTPAELMASLEPDATRLRAVVIVALDEAGDWHVRHSTTQHSIVCAASVHLLRFAQEQH